MSNKAESLMDRLVQLQEELQGDGYVVDAKVVQDAIEHIVKLENGIRHLNSMLLIK